MIEEIIKLYSQGYTKEELAKKFHTTKHHIATILSSRGISRLSKDTVEDLLKKGYKAKEIAKMLDISRATLYAFLSKQNIKRRYV